MLLFLAGGLAVLAFFLVGRRVYGAYRMRLQQAGVAGEASSSDKVKTSEGRQVAPMVKKVAIVVVCGVVALFVWRGQLAAAVSSLPALVPFLVNWMPVWRTCHRLWSEYRHTQHGGGGAGSGGSGGSGTGGQHQHGGGRAYAQAMTRQEALEILGLQDTHPLDDDAINKAYKDLMRRVHPDQGGSTGLAVTLNQARDTLLGC